VTDASASKSRPFWRNPVFVVVCGTMIVFLAYGTRQSFGIYVLPIEKTFGWLRGDISLVFAVQSLIYGLSAPFTGMIADRWGPIKVLVAAGALYATGIYLMANSTTPTGMMISAGLFGGVGSAGCALSLVLAVVSRAAPEEKRSLWLGIVTSGGTAGQLLLVPAGQVIMDATGGDWVFALMVVGSLTLMIVPLALVIGQAGEETLSKKSEQTLGQALAEARGHRGFWLLVTGFFVCGFQVQFINNHLPPYLGATELGALVGATAISVIGLFNMFGTWISGWLGGRFRKKYLLSYLYMLRSLAFLVFISVPLSLVSVYVFAATIGLLWLATVPLTSGIVAQIFGSRYMATLYGIVFLSHQLGSFSSVWLGGKVFDATGSYDIAWWVIIAAGFVAALLHWPINDTPVARVLAEREAAAKSGA
jgi:MFS family permease